MLDKRGVEGAGMRGRECPFQCPLERKEGKWIPPLVTLRPGPSSEPWRHLVKV